MRWISYIQNMRLVTRAIALLIIPVFLPASVLSAAPLVWCVAGDEHAAIEISLSQHSHVGEQATGSTSADAADKRIIAVGEHENPCIDYDLKGLAIASASADVETVTTATLVPYGAQQASTLNSARLAALSPIRPPPQLSRLPAGLLELRTIKLRL